MQNIFRISRNQKKALLLIHFVELKHGLHTPVHTSYLRKHVEQALDVKIAANNFRVSLHTLADCNYLVYQRNTEQLINAHARDNENMWQLTEKGRQYAETLYSADCRPKRRYSKCKSSFE